MHRKLITIGVVVAVAAVIVGVTSTISAITRPVTFTVVAPTTDEADLDLGQPGPSLGDTLIFSGPLLNTVGEMIGRIDGHCVTTSAPGSSAERRRQCFVTSTFREERGAELQAAGVGRVEAEDVVLAVTGGSGRYLNVRGEAKFDYRRQGRVVITYDLIP